MKISEIMSQCWTTDLLNIEVEGRLRSAIIMQPLGFITATGCRKAIIWLDSWSIDERHGAPIVNGGHDLCRKVDALSVSAFPARRGKFSYGWNTPNGAIRTKPGWDDINYLHRLIASLRDEHGPLDVYLVAFSDASMLAHIAAYRLAPGTIRGVVSVNGTVDPSLPLPHPGIKFLCVHGTENTMLPFHGGVGTSLRARLTAWLLSGDRARASRPDMQAPRYAAANGFSEPTEVESSRESHTTWWGQECRQILVEGGGHEWFGRRRGGKMESPFSRGNAGRNTSFDVNQAIALFVDR